MVKDCQRFFRYDQLVWVGPRCPRCFKMERNGYCIRTPWALKARRPTSKSTHVRPSSPSVWSNHILCSFYFEFSNLSNVQILLIGHVDQVFHKFCGAIPPSLMVFFWHWIIIIISFSCSEWEASDYTKCLSSPTLCSCSCFSPFCFCPAPCLSVPVQGTAGCLVCFCQLIITPIRPSLAVSVQQIHS